MTNGLAERIRRGVGSLAVDGFYGGLADLFRHHPLARPERWHIEVLRDVPYTTSGEPEHRLDVYRPTDREGPRPVVLYVHGGGFRILSKDTHWVMALAYARRGCIVFNINYHLAPKHRYPTAFEDVAAAYGWLARNAESYGGDPRHLILAGESAGANLVTALTVAACYRRDEPAAKAVWDTGLAPRGLWPACGLLQTTDCSRFKRRRPMSVFVHDRLIEVETSYLGAGAQCGDPRYDRLGAPCEARYYEGELHAFQALVFRKNARRCWRDTFAFFSKQLELDLCETTHLPLEGPSSILTALWRTRSTT